MKMHERRTTWPMPAYRYVPGEMPHPGAPPAHVHAVPMDTAFAWGLDLYEHGFWWEAHEVWEGRWRALEPGPHREILQGCVQAAASLLLVRLGRGRPSELMRGRALARLVVPSADLTLDGVPLAPIVVKLRADLCV